MKINKKIVAIFIIVLSIILLVLLCILSQLKQNTKTRIDDTLIPNGLQNKYPMNTIAVSQQYKGNLQMKDISTAVSEFMTGTIPFLKEHTVNMQEKEITEYYSNNSTNIKKKLGNLTELEFLNLIKEIQKLSNEKLEYESSEYLKESIVVDGGDLDVKLQIKYKDENEILIKVHIPTSSYSIKFVS